ncbi:MAG: 50S ribosomal protein L29 [Alphaproteobacteria bacterium]|nr:50S ribosomal protein L29 [Alphaproteobacteria bacterium]
MAEKKTTKTTKTAKAENAALNTEALQSKLIGLKKDAMNLRFQHAAGQLPKTHEIRKNRREIARVKTALGAGNK